jgi:hypothetical protein
MQYKAVLKSLRVSSKSLHPDTAAKANGLLDRFEDGATLLLLQTARSPLKNLNKSLQAESSTLNGMLQPAETTLLEFQRLRSVSVFGKLLQKFNKQAEHLNIEIRVPCHLQGTLGMRLLIRLHLLKNITKLCTSSFSTTLLNNFVIGLTIRHPVSAGILRWKGCCSVI